MPHGGTGRLPHRGSAGAGIDPGDFDTRALPRPKAWTRDGVRREGGDGLGGPGRPGRDPIGPSCAPRRDGGSRRKESAHGRHQKRRRRRPRNSISRPSPRTPCSTTAGRPADRRGPGPGPRPPAGPPQAERRAKKERRRRVDPTTFEKQYTEDEIEFMTAMQGFKIQSGKAFPTHGDILQVALRSATASRPPEEGARRRGPLGTGASDRGSILPRGRARRPGLNPPDAPSKRAEGPPPFARRGPLTIPSDPASSRLATSARSRDGLGGRIRSTRPGPPRGSAGRRRRAARVRRPGPPRQGRLDGRDLVLAARGASCAVRVGDASTAGAAAGTRPPGQAEVGRERRRPSPRPRDLEGEIGRGRGSARRSAARPGSALAAGSDGGAARTGARKRRPSGPRPSPRPDRAQRPSSRPLGDLEAQAGHEAHQQESHSHRSPSHAGSESRPNRSSTRRKSAVPGKSYRRGGRVL